MPKNFKNPTSPHDSPIKVEHHGGWDPTKYKNYVQPSQSRGLKAPVFGRTTVHNSVYEYQQSKTDEAVSDRALEAAIKRDNENRGIQ